jgi:hypothetical protein
MFGTVPFGQAERMPKFIRHSMIVAAALAPIAAVTVGMPTVGSAQPPNCGDGWWDPVANVCRPSVVQPLLCENGWWWDPVANVCRPPAVPPPPNCGDGQYWNPVANACRPLGSV